MTDTELKHRVIINDISVGEISDDELTDIQRSGYFDKKIYFKQAIAEFIAHFRKTALEVVIKDALDVLLTFWFLGWMLQCLILRRVPGFSNEFREATYSHKSGGKMSLITDRNALTKVEGYPQNLFIRLLRFP